MTSFDLLFFLFRSPKIDCKVGCSLATISILCQNMLLFSIHIVFKFKLCRLVRVWEDQRHLTTSPPILHIKLSPVHQFSSTVPDLEIQTSQTVNHQKPLHATTRSHPSEVKVNAAARHTPSVWGVQAWPATATSHHTMADHPHYLVEHEEHLEKTDSSDCFAAC